MLKIILTDWAGYPLYRRKRLKRTIIQCGLMRILESMNTFDGEHDFECILIINSDPSLPENSRYRIPTPSFFQCKENSKSTYLDMMKRFTFIKKVIFRDNSDMDIGAYDFGIKYLRETSYQGDIILMNSSVAPANTNGWLKKYYDLFHKNRKIGFCGITLNSNNTCFRPSPFDPHVQSFFIYTSMEVLNTTMPKGLKLTESSTESKDNLVEEGEIEISRQILKAGYGITCTAFPEFVYFHGNEWTIPRGDVRTRKEFRSFANKM